MATQEVLEILINSTANLAGVAETTTALNAMSGTAGGAGGVGGLLGVNSQLEKHKTVTKEATVAERDLSAEASAAARATGALGGEAAHAVDRLAALGGVMGSGGALGIGIGAAIIGAGVVVEMGKSMIDITDKNQAAQSNLAQAFATQGRGLAAYQGEIDSFLTRNRRYISDQNEAKDAIASLIRAGFDWTQTQSLIGTALDMSAATHKSLTVSANALIQAHEGNARALKELGINVKDITDPVKNLETAQKDEAKAAAASAVANGDVAVRQRELNDAQRSLRDTVDRLRTSHADSTQKADELARAQERVNIATDNLSVAQSKATTASSNLKTANQDLTAAQGVLKDGGDKWTETVTQINSKVDGARKTTGDLRQSQNELGATWSKLSQDQGPGLESMLAGLLDGTDRFLNYLGDQGRWNAINGYFVGAARDVKAVEDAFDRATAAVNNFFAAHARGDSRPGSAAYSNLSGLFNP